MIPRLKPWIGFSELRALFSISSKDAIHNFEMQFAQTMQQNYAVAVPYGRTGLLLTLQALGLKDREIICPAYTCVVVPHAIVYSGNKPVFVDCEPDGFNMDLEQVEAKISEKTGAIIATSLFGYPVNLDILEVIQSKHPHVQVVQDCAHSFGVTWNRKPVQKHGIAAIYGLNISKIITSIFGGMVTTDDEEFYHNLKTHRDKVLLNGTWLKSLKRSLYLLAVYPTFQSTIYGIINKMERLGLLDSFVKYYDDNTIKMPDDYLVGMTSVEARVGRANLERYNFLLAQRKHAANYYHMALSDYEDFILPPENEESTYSHYVVRTDRREHWLQFALERGVQLGWLIEYNIPEMPAYGNLPAADFPYAAAYARSVINFPVWGGESIAKKVLRRLGLNSN